MIARFVLAAGLLSPTLAAAQAPDPCATAPQTCATLINTHATARTRIPNTAVDVSLSITFSDKDLPTVQRALGTKSETLLKYLRSEGVQRLITSSVGFQPETREGKNAPLKTVGYDGTLTISFRTSPDKAPDVLTGALSNGADSIDRTTFTPTEDEVATARRQLAAEATKTAMAQADSIAAAAGLHVVSVRQINMDSDVDMLRNLGGLEINSFDVRGGGGGAPAMMMPHIQTSAGDQSLAITVNLVAAANR